jgi:regulator of replication initiation timing
MDEKIKVMTTDWKKLQKMYASSMEERRNLENEIKHLRSGMQDILDDFQTTNNIMLVLWNTIKRIQELIE